jgi:hypothetical protein
MQSAERNEFKRRMVEKYFDKFDHLSDMGVSAEDIIRKRITQLKEYITAEAVHKRMTR